jgi:hypothetical protein
VTKSSRLCGAGVGMYLNEEEKEEFLRIGLTGLVKFHDFLVVWNCITALVLVVPCWFG